MPQKKSALKRVRQNIKRRLRNRSMKSRVKTFMKKVQHALEKKEIADATTYMRQFVSVIDKAVKANIYHKNTAARYKSRIMKQVSAFTKDTV